MTGDELKIIHFNTQGFQNKVHSINKFVKLYDPDILVITEHFQKNRNDLKKIDGYKIVNSFCRKHSERGGVAIWAKTEIPCTPRKDLDKHRKEREFELVSVSVRDDVVITGAYRPPDTSIVEFNDNLAQYLKKINQEPNIKHILTGDFNIDNSKHNSTRDVLKNHNLIFNITSETHRDGGCIDNFITNFKNSKSRVIKSKTSQFSDHSPIELIVEKEVTMIAEKQESLFSKIVSNLLFYKQNNSFDKKSESSKSFKKSGSEYCKTIFNQIYRFFFNGTCSSTSDPGSKKKKQKPQVKDEVPIQNTSLFSKVISFFTLDLLSKTSHAPRKSSTTKSGEIYTSTFFGNLQLIFRKIINWFK